MKVVFFGTDFFASEILRFLLEEGVDIVCVVTQEDKPQGRSQKVLPPPVKEFILQMDIDLPVFQPHQASSAESIETIASFSPDLFVVVSYGQLLKQNLLNLPKIGAINVHPSLLPKYRGPSPIRAAILNGDKEVGVTIMEMTLAMDAGNILNVKKIELPLEMSYGEVREKLCELSKEALIETIKRVKEVKAIVGEKQDEDAATFTKKVETRDAVIYWDKPAKEVHDLIRGMSPSPGARTIIQVGQREWIIKILKSSIVSDVSGVPGKILTYDSKEGWVVACKEQAIQILEVQPEGKKRMFVKDFMNGFQNIKIKQDNN